MSELELVDPTTNRYLSGRFAPVHREITTTEVEIEGTLPTDLVGAYLRNGPNAKFPPLGSYTFPMEGDGMIHAVWLDGTGARYKNRWVRTRGMEAEERAGKAIFGGLMTPAFVDQSLLGPDPDPGWPIRLDAFINIVHHAGRYLALEEGTPPYEVTAELETVGRYDFHGELPDGMCAHPKIDPATGDMIIFRYDLVAPFLTWAVIGADGHVQQPPTPIEPVDVGYMVHDSAITEHFLVLVLGPAVFDLDAMVAGGPLLKWQPDLGTRIAVIPRDGSGAVRWIETDAFWVWHFANAYEDGTRIMLDFPAWNVPGFLTPGTPVTGSYTSAVLDPGAGTIERTDLHDLGSEFPRIDDRLLGRRHRYVTVGAGSGKAATAGEHDLLCRVDLQTGEWVTADTGAVIGEVVFAPRAGSTGELDGYYLTFGTSLEDERSALYIWDADRVPERAGRARRHPAARPQRTARQLVRGMSDDGLARPIAFDAGYGAGVDRALVLGGGGVVFVAWLTAYLGELSRRGVVVQDAERIVGTSAGSVLATVIAAGRLDRFSRLIRLVEERPSLIGRLAPAAKLAPSQQRAVDLFDVARDAETATVRAIGAAASAAHTPGVNRLPSSVALMTQTWRWPSERLVVSAVDVYNGERLALEQRTGVPLLRAVAASASVPGLFAPQPVGDRRAMDGGVSGSGIHSDLVAGARRALVFPIAGELPEARMTIAADATDREMVALRAAGTEVEVRHSRLPYGTNLMDPAEVPTARRARHRAGRGRCPRARRILGPRRLNPVRARASRGGDGAGTGTTRRARRGAASSTRTAGRSGWRAPRARA